MNPFVKARWTNFSLKALETRIVVDKTGVRKFGFVPDSYATTA
jgi:hypothetical protein